jgi:hypothetical protein
LYIQYQSDINLGPQENAMLMTLLVTFVFHVASGVFWAGSTFAMARTGAASADKLIRPQMGAAVVVVITGGILWHLLHPSSFGRQEDVLAVGALAAVVAAGVQGVLCGRALRQLARGDGNDPEARARVAIGHRIASGLLAVTVICMAAARYI